jgi:teichoic acid transport system permease protein
MTLQALDPGFPGSASPIARADGDLSPAELAARHGLTVPGRRPPFIAYLRSLVAYHGFAVSYARAKISSVYSTARLGAVWTILTPVLNVAVYYFVFGYLLDRKAGVGESYIGFLSIGVYFFSYTREAFAVGTKAVADRMNLIRAIHFPRALLPVAVVLQQLFLLCFSLVVMLWVLVAVGEVPSTRWLGVLPALFLQTLFNLGAALIMARIGAVLRDVGELIPWVLRVWMYTCGVMYSINKLTVHAPTWVRIILELNPGAVYIELARHALLDGYGNTTPDAWPVACFWALLSLGGGLWFFWRAEDRYGRG